MGVSTGLIQTYLKDIDYPVNKSQLIKHAQQHGATQDVMNILHKLPEQEFRVPTDVNEAVSKVE
jgi:hypothetical protein